MKMLNEIFGRNITLRELQSFFFDTLGMLPITYYGARGDNRTDNYGNLQIAIDDANKRGLRYLYVPYGKYLYRGELINRENIAFVGNPKAEIINSKTGEKIPIHQFGVCEYGCLKYGNCSSGSNGGNTPNPSYGDKFQAVNGESYFDTLEDRIGYDGYAVYLYNSSSIALGDGFSALKLPTIMSSYTLDTLVNTVEQIQFSDGSYIEGTYNSIKYVNSDGVEEILYTKNSENIFERQYRNGYICDCLYVLSSSGITVTSVPPTTYFLSGIKKAIYDGCYLWTTSGWVKDENAPDPRYREL